MEHDFPTWSQVGLSLTKSAQVQSKVGQLNHNSVLREALATPGVLKFATFCVIAKLLTLKKHKHLFDGVCYSSAVFLFIRQLWCLSLKIRE